MKRNVLILRHFLNEPAGSLETALTDAGLTFEYVDLFKNVPKEIPLAQAGGLVVLGGTMNVDEVDKYPFLARDVGWIQAAVAGELPMLGICLGAQLLAKAMGARVYPNRHREIGWYPIELTPQTADDALFGQVDMQMTFQWHGDTFDMPSGAVHLACSPLCENQAFRYGPRAWGLQFHIEMTAKMVNDWVREADWSGELARWNVDPQVIRRQTNEELPRLQAIAKQVFGRFAAMCKGH
jgi:GMP synthase (glutamine-hydrolysing)